MLGLGSCSKISSLDTKGLRHGYFLGFSHFIAICCQLLRLMRDLLYSLLLSIGFRSWAFGLFLQIMHKIAVFRGALALDLWPRPGP